MRDAGEKIMETMKKWLRNTITNAWIGKATKAGLVEAMDELYYTWGSEGMGPFAGAALVVTKEDKNYPVKLAA